MPQQPGPFRLASPAEISIVPGVYDFTADGVALQAELGAIGDAWDPLITNLTDFAAAPWDGELAFDIDGLLGLADVYGAAMPPHGLSEALDGWSDAQAMLGIAVSFAPVQAWTDPGAPFVPPDSALTIVPAGVDPAAFFDAPNNTVGASTSGRIPAVAFFNLTHYGAQNFTVGDEFEVVALGHEDDDVLVASVLNGEKLPDVDYGAIDNTGQMFIRGTIPPEAAGTWAQQWYISGQIIANFTFIVTPE